MAWVKIDDQFFVNRKARSIGLEGRALYLASICYCGMQLNDGQFPESDVPVIAALADVPSSTADVLYDAGCWHLNSGVIEVHDYLKYNPSREQVVARKERAEKAAAVRHSATSSAGSSPLSRPIPSPSPDEALSSSSTMSRTGLPEGLWTTIAEKKLKLVKGVNNPQSWKRKVAENAEREMSARAFTLVASYDLSTSQLADVLLSDTNPQWLQGCKRGGNDAA